MLYIFLPSTLFTTEKTLYLDHQSLSCEFLTYSMTKKNTLVTQFTWKSKGVPKILGVFIETWGLYGMGLFALWPKYENMLFAYLHLWLKIQWRKAKLAMQKVCTKPLELEQLK